jgi:hypothetical protein
MENESDGSIIFYNIFVILMPVRIKQSYYHVVEFSWFMEHFGGGTE